MTAKERGKAKVYMAKIALCVLWSWVGLVYVGLFMQVPLNNWYND